MKLSKNPKVTVLMPVYNGERYLREAVESILDQTFTDFEFLIINDGSTDRTVKIIESYSDPRIRLVHNEKNMKLIATLNKGLKLARGEYIARVDCDDISLPERLAKQVAFMDANPEVGVLGTAFQTIDSYGKSLNSPILYPSQYSFLRWSLCFYSPIVHPTVMMRKELVLGADGYSPEAIHVEDYDLWRRLSGVTQLSNLQDVLIYLRKHDANVTEIYLTEHFKNAEIINRLIISETLGEDISVELVRSLRNQEFKEVKDVIRVSNLIDKLYRAFVYTNKLSTYEKKLIRKDAASRLLTIARPYIRDIRVLYVLFLVFRLDSILMVKSALGAFNRLLIECRMITRKSNRCVF
jgi:glycosyltransferase involved in cell wall biosynthesis